MLRKRAAIWKRTVCTGLATSKTVEPLESRRLFAAITWIGTMGNWNDPTQWSTGVVPAASDDAIIDAGATISVSDGEAPNTITEAAGSTINIASTGTLQARTGGTLSGTVNDAGLFYGSNVSTTPLLLAGVVNVTLQFNSGYFTNAGTFNLTGSAAVMVSSQLTNQGTFNVAQGPNMGSATITNVSPGAIYFTDDAGVTSFGTIINTGTISKTGGTGTTVLPNGGTLEDLGGTISSQTGTLSLASFTEVQNTTFSAVAGAAVSFDGSATSYSNAMYVSGTITGTGAGNLNFDSGEIDSRLPNSGGSTTLTSATFNFPADFAQFTGTDVRAGSLGQLINAGQLQFVGDAQHPVIDVDNRGTITVSGAGSLGFGDQTAFVNDTTGVVDLTSDAGLLAVGDGNGGSFTVTNKGLIEKTGGTGTSPIGAIDNGIGFEDEGGTITANTGTIDFPSGAALENTTLNAAAGATIAFDDPDGTGDGVGYYFSGTLTGSGAGNVVFAGNGAATRGPYDNSFTPTTGAILNFPAGLAQVTGMLFQGGGVTEIINQGFLNYTGAAQHPGMGLDNKGTIDVTGTGNLGASSDGGFINDTTGVLNFETDAGVSGVGGNTAFTNMGLIEKTGGTGESIIGTVAGGSISFVSEGGPFVVDSGTLSLQDGDGDVPITFGGITVATGATLNIDAGRVFASGTFSATGGGQVTFSGGNWYGPNTGYGQDGTTPAMLNFAPGSFVDDGGEFADSTNLINTGAIDFTGANILNGLLNRGTMLFTDTGPFNFSGTLINDTAGIMNFQDDTVINILGNNNLQSNGTILKSGGSGTLDLSNTQLTNAGKIEVSSGTINLPDSRNLFEYSALVVATGSIYEVDAGATITVANSPALTGIDGTVILGAGASFPAIDSINNVTGSFQVLSGESFTTAGDLADTGTIVVGGNLTVNGAFTMSQSATSTTPPALQFAVQGAPGSAAAPSFSVTGAATLAGNLSAGYAGGFAAAAGTKYTVATFASAPAGSFADTTGTAPDFTQTVNSSNILFNATGAGGTPTGGTTPSPIKTIGGLDSSFGTNGLASHNVGFVSTGGLVADGSQSVIIGTIGTSPTESFGLTRYNADGSLDTAFGNGGVVSTNFGGTADVPMAVHVLLGGNILVAGTATTFANGVASGSEFAVAEYNSNGSLDANFGGGTGEVLVSFSSAAGALSNDLLHALAVGATGAIYLGGSSDAAGNGNIDFAIASISTAGMLNTSFGAGGRVLLDFASGDDQINSLAVQSNGQVVAAGAATVGGTTEIALTRFLANGAVDPHFGVKGLVTTKVGGVYDSASSVVIQPKGGAIVIGGLTASGSSDTLSSDFVVQRYTTAGRLDRTFGGTGTVTTSFGQPAAITQVILQSNGDIVASGKTTPNLGNVTPNMLDVALARYTTRGTLDASFNGTGKTVIDLNAGVISTSAVSAGDVHATAGQLIASDELTAQFVLQPLDASSLGDEFNQFVSSEQGVVAVTAGGEILDAGNSGSNTVEAELIAAGVDLLTKLLSVLPASVLGGSKATASVSITESGTTFATGTVTIEIEFATDAAGDGAVTAKSMSERISLKQGQSKPYKVQFNYPSSLASGGYYLLANVVDGSTLSDLNENNNIAPSSTAVTISPPTITLVGSTLSATSTFTPGKLVSVMFDVTNNGNVQANGKSTVQLYLSGDQTAADGTQIIAGPLMLSLAANKLHPYTLKFTLLSTVGAGTYYLIGIIDPSNSLGTADNSDSTVIDVAQVVIS